MGEHLRAVERTVDDVVAGMEVEGYAVVEGVLGDDQVVASAPSWVESSTPPPRGATSSKGSHPAHLRPLRQDAGLRRAGHAPARRSACSTACWAGSYQFSAPVGICIGPGEAAQVLHRDDAIYPLPWPHGEVVVNTMWAFDDFTVENGATRVVPGSHRWPTGEYAGDEPRRHASRCRPGR